MKQTDCIFCKIANGDIPSTTIHETEELRVILDISPASKGHALILPKEHFTDLYELKDEIASTVMITAKNIITKMTKILECDGYNIVQNNGSVAGQTVFHYHLHLIPRYKDDKLKLDWESGNLTQDIIDDVLQKLAK